MYTRLLLTWTALSLISTALAENRRERSIRANVDLVLVPVTVLDNKGAMVTGLEREHFTLLQDNIPQNILSFSRQDVPCSVGIIVDTSGSMSRQMDAAKAAVRGFLETAEGRDRAFSMTFADRPTPVWSSIRSTGAPGNTAFLDTLYLALSHIRTARNLRRALLVVSDGMDNHSRYSRAELMRVAMEAGAQIYSVSIGAAGYKKPIEEHAGSVLLDDLADRTGGLHYTVVNRDQASQAAARIGQALRNQYVIGYRPQDTDGSGKWRKIRVKLDVPKAIVYTRSGYYSR